MLDFFRRYQRYFFLVITVVIVISFSFFGTYSTIPAENIREQVAFTAIDGSQIQRSDLEEMVLFLSTDSEDKIIFGGIWGPNFLNDGVVRKDFLQTGLGEILAAQYEPLVAAELQKRLEKEKRFALYSHPEAAFINIEAVWEYFAPDMKSNYGALKRSTQATSNEALAARVRLYLAERRLPPPMLKQILRYQEKQNNWVTPDASLDRTDLSLFGYHTLDDWFGTNFIRLTSEFMINAAKVAEQKGYVVTKEEALADLMRNAQTSYQQNLKNQHLGVSNSAEYFNEQLRRMNMDQAIAVKIWRQVLLFRRLFQDIGQSVFVDPFSFEQVNAYAKQSASGDLYQLPKELQLNNYSALQKLEVYLAAVSKRPTEESKLLELPTVFLSPTEVAKNYPELVEKRYFLEISDVEKKNIQSKVGLKQSWEWQVQDANWAKLKKEFPELAVKKGDSRDERFATLESLDDRTRSKIDVFSRDAIIDSRPEFLSEALEHAEAKRQVVGLTLKGDSLVFQGLKDPKKMMALLDQAPLAGEDLAAASDKAKNAQEQLNAFSDDKQHYYRIRVLERKPDLEILTFAEASKNGALDKIVDKKLEAFYQQNREQNAAAFQKEDKSWKSLAEVRSAVADLYFAKILKAIRQDYAKAAPKDKKRELTLGDNAAPYRLYAYVRTIKEALEKAPEKATGFVREAKAGKTTQQLTDREPLADQWKLERKEYIVDRAKEEKKFNPADLFAIPLGSWTAVETHANGDLFFFQKTGNVSTAGSTLVADKIDQARRLLSDDSQRAYMKHFVKKLKDNHAISLDYVNRPVEIFEESDGEIQ